MLKLTFYNPKDITIIFNGKFPLFENEIMDFWIGHRLFYSIHEIPLGNYHEI